MSDKLFVFFGCSWTYGKFITFPNTDASLAEESELADQLAFRSLITKHFNADQKNFSEGGSSNGKQFRLASEYFYGTNRSITNRINLIAPIYNKLRLPNWPTIEEIKKTSSLPDYIIDEFTNIHQQSQLEFLRKDSRKKFVIWFITSTARYEFFNATKRMFENFMLASHESDLSKVISADYYDHTHELEVLANSMKLWNSYFKLNNIQNVWIDTFNHHDYPIDIENRVTFNSKYSDIMSNLAIQSGLEFDAADSHQSIWVADDIRSTYLVDLGLLNKKTIHPTIEGHREIANLLIPKLENFFVV